MAISFSTKTLTQPQSSTDAVVVITSQFTPGPLLKVLEQAQPGLFSKALKNAEAKPGLVIDTHLPASGKNSYNHVFVVQASSDKKRQTTTPKDLNKALAQVAAKLLACGVKDATVFADACSFAEGEADIELFSASVAREFERAAYRYTATFSDAAARAVKLKRVIVANASAAEGRRVRKSLATGSAVAEGINTARELGNLPGNYCAPRHLADYARDLASRHDTLTTRIHGLKAIEKMKMGSFLSVAKGSVEEPKLIVMEYKGKASARPHVLVGKGITFDTGGISLKPGPGMDEMKFDMCGAASVVGTIAALAAMKAPVHVVGIIAAAENMPAGNASKPGDVVTSMSGKTIEVLNTDAEGRLVLCDALTFAERYKPKSVVDVATLTGACVIALGNHASGLYANDQTLADKLLKAGEASGDRAWQMPLWEEYHQSLKSNFADMANIGGREAGSVTAACFLSKFAEAYPWAHLDIAGSAWKSGGAKGATGRPVELLVEYLCHHAG